MLDSRDRFDNVLSLMHELLSPCKPDLHAVLRAQTGAAHARLETSLGLLDPPLERARFMAVLQGFWGFHRVWEPSLQAHPELRNLLAGRSRLAQLERDLAALGLTAHEIETLPLCADAARLQGSAMRMLGSVYVLEGSTLGGQVIGRALQGQDWLPEGGFLYFNPYAAQTGAMWRALRDALDAASTSAGDVEIVGGATAAFEVLNNWLPMRPVAGGTAN